MKKPISNLITLFLAVFGCILAVLLTIEHFHPATLPCSVRGTGCAGTLSSTYAQIGPIPTSLFGLGMYALFAVLCWKRKEALTADRLAETARAQAYAASDAPTSASDNASSPLGSNGIGTEPLSPPNTASAPASNPQKAAIKRLDQMIWLLAAAGFCISWWLQYVAIWELHSFCPYCFTSALTVTTIFALASRDYLLDGRLLNGEQKLLIGVIGVVLLYILSTQVVPDAQIQVSHGAPPPVNVPGPLVRDVVIRPGLHAEGNPNAKYTLVEFADYFCPHCKEVSEKLPEILKAHPDVKFIYRNYPLGFPMVKFVHSDKASISAEAAGLQDKFWPMHDFLFAHQKAMNEPTFTDDMFVDYARQLGLDTEKFKQDIADQKTLARVIQDHDDGDQGGMSLNPTTPTFFLVTPDRVTRFVGDPDLQKIMDDPKNDAWK